VRRVSLLARLSARGTIMPASRRLDAGGLYGGHQARRSLAGISFLTADKQADEDQPMKWKVAVGVVALIFFSLYANLRLFRTIFQYSDNFRDSALIQYYDGKRFAKLKAALRPHEVVGYVDDEPESSVQRLAKHKITRYVLVPALVASGPDYPLVIGNFKEGNDNRKQITSGEWRLVQDFGKGLKLFRTQGPR
jgi:hypothetical protein